MPCTCTGSGFCKTHNRHMSEVRFQECRDKPGYFEVFQEAKTEDRNVGKPPTSVYFDPTSRESVEQRIGTGPGTELILILAGPMWKRIGIRITTGCKCRKHAATMNEQGPKWCVENIVIIVKWLKHEHSHQRIRMPFSNVMATMLIRTAIRRARRRHEHSRQSDPDADQQISV